MSRASSFAAMAQQMGISLGVACAATTLNLSMHLRGGIEVDRIDVTWGFVVTSLFVAASALSFRRLSRRAGSQLHTRAR